MIALTQTLLPDPVAPAMSRCGMRDRSALNGWPATSWPSAKASLLRADASSKFGGAEHLLERDQVEGAVRDLDPDVRLARDRRLDADAARLQVERQVVGQALDPRELDPRLHVERVLRDDRPLLDARHLHPDPEVRQRLADALSLGGQVELRRAAGRRVVRGAADLRQLPGARRRASRAASAASCVLDLGQVRGLLALELVDRDRHRLDRARPRAIGDARRRGRSRHRVAAPASGGRWRGAG